MLLDTHALLWWLTDDPRLSNSAHAAIVDPDNEVRVSAVSAWELAIKMSIGRLPVLPDLRRRLDEAMERDRMLPMDVTAAHGFAVGELPLLHRDPFDRLLVAQARCERCQLVSDDRQLRRYPVDLLW